jgi:hypothetical protein
VPFVKPVTVYVNAVAGDGVAGGAGSHISDVAESALYCILYEDKGIPPL